MTNWIRGTFNLMLIKIQMKILLNTEVKQRMKVLCCTIECTFLLYLFHFCCRLNFPLILPFRSREEQEEVAVIRTPKKETKRYRDQATFTSFKRHHSDADSLFNERKISVVQVIKDTDHGLGMTLSSRENGVFIEAMEPNGPAVKNGRIKVGDKLLAINGQSVEGLRMERIFKIISNTSNPLQLLLSQNMNVHGDLLPRDNLQILADVHVDSVSQQVSVDQNLHSQGLQTSEELKESKCVQTEKMIEDSMIGTDAEVKIALRRTSSRKSERPLSELSRNNSIRSNDRQSVLSNRIDTVVIEKELHDDSSPSIFVNEYIDDLTPGDIYFVNIKRVSKLGFGFTAEVSCLQSFVPR